MDSKLQTFLKKASEIENAKLYIKNLIVFDHDGDNPQKDMVAIKFQIKNTKKGTTEAEYVVYAKNMEELFKKVNQLENDYFKEYEIEEDY
jgi:hypothetical protein